MNRARLSIVDSAALVSRARAEDWQAVEDLAGEVVAGDHAVDLIELLARLLAGALGDLAVAQAQPEDHVFEQWIASAAEAVGGLV